MKQIDSTRPNHIMIGLGGTGGKVLKAFRKRLWEDFPKVEDRRKLSIGFVYIDSTDEMMRPGDPTWRVYGQNAQFEESEFVNIKTIDLKQILDNTDNYPGLKNIIQNGEMMNQTMGEVGDAAGQKRRAGRILFAANISKYISAVETQYKRVTDISKNKSRCHIHIFAGLAGGTGSGSIIDAVAQLRTHPSFSGNETSITVYAMVPELDIPEGCQAGRYHQNGYAALSELSALNAGVYLPCDVRTGAKHVSINTIPLKQFGLMVYSNVNENGAVAESFNELPQLLADTIYHTVFMKFKGAITEPFIHGLACENFPDYYVEYSALSKGNDKERARTKAVSSFGIKRIVYPEQRIVEHVSYTLADSVFRQMVYNNFLDDIGFTDEVKRKDYNATYIKDEKNMRDWKLNDSFLTLNERILSTDKKFESIDEYWKNQSDFYSYDDVKNVDSIPVHYLEGFMLEKYREDFRFKQGVEEYYSDKGKDEVLRTQAEDIVDAIERNLYTQWYEGQLSLTDLIKVCDAILNYIRDRRAKIPADIQATDERIDGFVQEAEDNVDYVTHLNILQKATGKPKDCYTDHQAILADLYSEKTRRVALEFAAKLLSKIQVCFEEFQEQTQKFVGVLSECMKEAANRISDRSQQKGSINDMRQAIIEVREDAKVATFEKSLLLNRNRMETLSGILRRELVGNKPFEHFDKIADNLTVDKAFDIIDNVMGQQVRDIHETERAKDRLIGINVLQQLQKVLITDDDIRHFAQEAVNTSGVFILLDDNQLQRFINNNPNPVEKPESINRKSILVTFPASEGDDALKTFAQKLKDAFTSAFGNATPGSTIRFDNTGEESNEITIASVKNCFPLRAIKWMPIYEREYRNMTESPNPREAREARVILHSEGDGTCLPPIMGEQQPTAQEFTPYYFAAAAMGILHETNDPINGNGWCLAEEDEWGSPLNTYLSQLFTDLPVCENMTTERRQKIKDLVDGILDNPELTMVKRNEYADNVKALMRDTVGKECTSPTSPKYRQFSSEAKRALEMICKNNL